MKTCLLVLLFSVMVWAQDAYRCSNGGGGGGVPLSVITNDVQSSNDFIKTESLVKDFTISEQQQVAYYRSEREELRRISLVNFQDEMIFSRAMNLSRVMDREARYVISNDGSYYLDTQTYPKVWRKIPYPTGISRVEPAFWHSGSLYSFGHMKKGQTQQILYVFEYNPETNRLESCLETTPLSDAYRFASGHSSPYIYLYKTKNVASGVDLTPLRINVSAGLLKKKCKLELLPQYKDPMPGPVLSMHRLENMDAFIIRLDHPTKNLLWDRGPECIFYNTEDRVPIVLNNFSPFVATWKAGAGLQFLNVQQSKGFALKDFGKSPIRAKDLWLTHDAETLYFAESPYGSGSDDKMLLKFDFRKLTQ